MLPSFLRHPLAQARLIVCVLAIAPLVMVASPFRDGAVLIDGIGHVVLSGFMGLVALVTACFVSRAAWRHHDVRAGLVASGFTALSALLVVHALATPGGPIFNGVTSTVQVAGVMSMPIGAAFIAIAMSVSARAESSRRRAVTVQVATMAGTALFGVVGLTRPELIPAIPLMDEPYSTWVLVASLPTLAFAALRVHRVADITRRPCDASMFIGILTLAMAISSYVLSTPFDAQFWLGHALEAIALVCISIGVVGDLRRPVSAWRLTMHHEGQAFVETSEQLLGGFVHALTVRLAHVDPSTWHHSRRVAELAVQVAEELGLEAEAVRRIAVAGLVHDIGKLRIPHDVLHKAGKLTEEEFDFIKAHPDFGVELLSQLRGFDREIPIVLGHHEKLSGRGYPAGLTAEEISLETRIMTVCDVYDALTDARSYKEPWPPHRAIALLHEERGVSFDGDVVDALERVVARRTAAAFDGELPQASADLDPVVPLHRPVPAITPIDLPSGIVERPIRHRDAA